MSVVLWYILEHLCLQWNAIQALSDVQWNISISLASWVWVIKAPRWQMLLSVMLMMTNCIIFCVPIRYLIPSLDRSHAGHYRCIVRNRVGAIMQCSTEVQVACKCFFFSCIYMGNIVFVNAQQVNDSDLERALMKIILYFDPFIAFLRISPVVLIFLLWFIFDMILMSARYGWFCGGWEVSNCIPGQWCSHSSATDTQLPQAPDHLVQRWS